MLINTIKQKNYIKFHKITIKNEVTGTLNDQISDRKKEQDVFLLLLQLISFYSYYSRPYNDLTTIFRCRCVSSCLWSLPTYISSSFINRHSGGGSGGPTTSCLWSLLTYISSSSIKQTQWGGEVRPRRGSIQGSQFLRGDLTLPLVPWSRRKLCHLGSVVSMTVSSEWIRSDYSLVR